MADVLALNHERKKSYSFFDHFWYEFRRNWMAVAGLVFLVVIFFVAIFAKQIMPFDPLHIDPQYIKGVPSPPDAVHPWGTDEMGRDVFSRSVSGSRISLSVGFVSVGISTIIGVILGSLAGYYGGRIDNIIMRIADIFLSLPTFYLILTVNALLKPSIYNIMVIIGVFGWMGVSRLVRGEFMRIKEMDYITSARATGVSNSRLILKHLLPNSVAPIIVSMTNKLPGAILLESGLSFLGLGTPPPAASWGNMLFDGKTWLHQSWWMWVPPGFLISITVIAFNFLGDALRDSLDPLQRQR